MPKHSIPPYPIWLDPTLPFYVYSIFHPDRTPMWVGKGSGNRLANQLKNHDNPDARQAIQRIRELGYCPYYTMRFFKFPYDAFVYEAELIFQYGRLNVGTGPLFNLQPGGPEFDPRVPRRQGRMMMREWEVKISIHQLKYRNQRRIQDYLSQQGTRIISTYRPIKPEK